MRMEEKVGIAGKVSRIAGVMQNNLDWLPFPLFTRRWRNYPEFFNETTRDDFQISCRRGGIQNAEEFQAAALLGVKHGLLDSHFSDHTIGGLGCDVLLCPDDYRERVAAFVIGSQKAKALSADQINKEQRKRFQPDQVSLDL